MITGVINSLWTKPIRIKNGPNAGNDAPVTLFTVEGTDGTFNLGFGKQQVAEGDEVSFNHQELKYGEYPVDKNTLKIVSRGNKVEKPTPTASSGTPAKVGGTGSAKGGYSRGSFPLDFTDGQRSILRQHAFTQARELLVSQIDTGERRPDDLTVAEVITAAYEIEKYTSGDDLRDEMKESE